MTIAQQRASASADPPTVLVVDDEAHIRDGCCKVLSKEGFDVVAAECGEDGLKMIEERHFDIVLLDLMMPSLSGFDVLAQVKSLHPDTTIIVISGYATLEHSIEAMKKGAFDFIPKPFTPEQLRLPVTKAIEYTRALKDIANEKSRMRILINQLSDGVMATDNEKRLVLANPAFLRMVGYFGDTAVGQAVSQVVRYAELETMIDRALAKPAEECLELAEELEEPTGDPRSARVLNARCIPFRDRVGRNLGTVTVLHDITAQKKMDQIRSDFVSMVAHELRSPLNSILMQIQVVADGLAGSVSADQQTILARVMDKTRSLASLCSELLELARVESGLITQEKEQFSMAEILVDQVEFYRSQARAKGLSLNLEPLPPLTPIMASRRNMEEVLTNLIANAVKYTPQGGKITVSAGVEGGYVRVSVADTGFGIAREDQEKIFAPFYRVKDQRTRFIAGTGLGLSIVKSIIEAHNGTIQVHSEPNHGTLFDVYIPSLTAEQTSTVAH